MLSILVTVDAVRGARNGADAVRFERFVRGRVWRMRLGLVVVLSLVASFAACDGGEEPLPIREAEPTPAAVLFQAVADALTSADLVEPQDEGLYLDVRGDLLFVRGVVDSDSRGQMYDVLKDFPDIQTVVLTAIPGSADDETNLALGRMLRQAGITTYLPARGMVASGGVDLFLSGGRRFVERGASVGVHSWADSDGTDGDDLPREDPLHGLYLEYYREMRIPEDFYWFSLQAAPPEGIHWMTEAEMERYAIYTDLR